MKGRRQLEREILRLLRKQWDEEEMEDWEMVTPESVYDKLKRWIEERWDEVVANPLRKAFEVKRLEFEEDLQSAVASAFAECCDLAESVLSDEEMDTVEWDEIRVWIIDIIKRSPLLKETVQFLWEGIWDTIATRYVGVNAQKWLDETISYLEDIKRRIKRR